MLFINAKGLGKLDRKIRELSEKDIKKIAEAYQNLTQEVMCGGKEARLRQRNTSEFIR